MDKKRTRINSLVLSVEPPESGPHTNQSQTNQQHINESHINQQHTNQQHIDQSHIDQSHTNQLHKNQQQINQSYTNHGFQSEDSFDDINLLDVDDTLPSVTEVNGHKHEEVKDEKDKVKEVKDEEVKGSQLVSSTLKCLSCETGTFQRQTMYTQTMPLPTARHFQTYDEKSSPVFWTSPLFR